MTPARLGIIIALLATALLGATGAIVYRLAQRTSQPLQKIVSVSPTKTPSPSTPSSDVLISADWKTYSDNKHSFSFSYPKTWMLTSSEYAKYEPRIDIEHGKTSLTIYLSQFNSGLETIPTLRKEAMKIGDKLVTFDYYNSLVTEQLSAHSDLALPQNTFPFYVINFHLDEGNSDSDLQTINQILSTFTFLISDDEKTLIDSWLQANNLNQYGDPKDRVYAGGTPLFDERTGERTDRYEYILKKFPERPWSQ